MIRNGAKFWFQDSPALLAQHFGPAEPSCRRRSAVLGGVGGMLLFLLLALLEKTLSQVPLFDWRGYIVPLLVGCIGGSLCGWWYPRLKFFASILQGNEYFYRQLADLYPEGILLCQGGQPLWLNAAACRLLGVSSVTELSPQTLAGFLDPAGCERLHDCIDDLAAPSPPAAPLWQELTLHRADGSTVTVEIHRSQPFEYHQRPVLQVILRDLSERKEAAARLQRSRKQLTYLTYYDPLTGLPNRLQCHLRLEQALQRAAQAQGQLALLWIDLDRFHFLNNSLGHNLSDNILQTVAERLRRCLENRPECGLIGRPGADEFMVLLEKISDIASVGVLGQRILTALAEPIQLEGHEVVVKASIGVSLYPDDASDPDNLMKAADAAVNRAKQEGGNMYQFYTLDIKKSADVLLGNDLWRALERGEFVLHYQPQVDILSRTIIGAEVLIRWQHPKHGLISPNRFIEYAEATGLVREIGDWVMLTACLQNKQWQSAGLPPIRIGVNLNGKQIAEEHTIEKVTAILHESRLAPQWLKLEVTESLIIANPEQAIINMQALKKLGTTLSIDDFGTGYSSFGYLKQLPVDELKIDREFIRDIPYNEHDMKITPAMIAIGHSLHLKVVAEGVENEAQLEFLKAHQCDAIQGYLFSPPVPADEFVELFKRDFNYLG